LIRTKTRLITTIKAQPLSSLLVALTAVTLAEFLSHFCWGYSLDNWAVLFVLALGPIRYLLILVCLGWIIWSIAKRQHLLRHMLICGVLVIIGFLPKGHFYTLGGIASIYAVGPEQVRADARVLLDSYPPVTHFGYPHRAPLNNPLPLDDLPSSLNNEFFSEVLVLDNYVAIEKAGLEGVFTGFTVFREGYDPWIDEGRIVLQKTCNACWKIRIIDGLYWFHDDPMGRVIFAPYLDDS
jgi:hypothetical protein